MRAPEKKKETDGEREGAFLPVVQRERGRREAMFSHFPFRNVAGYPRPDGKGSMRGYFVGLLPIWKVGLSPVRLTLLAK